LSDFLARLQIPINLIEVSTKTFSLIIGTVFLCSTAFAAPSQEKIGEREALKKTLTQVIDTSALKNARVSVQVKSLEDGAIVYARDADELLNPASNVKLYTAATALSVLGSEYRYETEFSTDEPVKEGKAKILFVHGKGDPTITTERLYGMVAELFHAGLREVNDIVLDDTWFDAERMAPGFDQEYGDKAYLAPTGALSLNWNTVGVYLRPGDNMGDKAAVEVEPPSDFFVIDSKVMTGNANQRHYTVTSGLDKDKVRQKIEATGFVPLEKGNWAVWKKVSQPTLYFGFTLREMMRMRGIKVKGRLRVGNAPTKMSKLIHVAQSETLDLILKKLNKNSSNFVAEQLIKTLGAEKGGVPGTHANGILAVEEFLKTKVGLARGTYVMRNGSGLNDSNRFSAAQTNRLLEYMMKNFPVMPEYLSSLGIAGKDGTLKFRFDGSDAVGRLRGKTGTLENVSALSGYVESMGGERFVFSIMVNDFPGRASSVVQYIDVLGAAVASLGSAAGPGQAVAALTTVPSILSPMDALQAQMKTYMDWAQKSDKRNVSFLRIAFRSEKDPAVRALIADALYQSDPRELSHARTLIESAAPGDEVYLRLRQAAGNLGLQTPVVSSLAELAAAGNIDAASRLIEFSRASLADEKASALLAEQLAIVSTDASTEWVTALKGATVENRNSALELLVRGLPKQGFTEGVLMKKLKEIQTTGDVGSSDFAKLIEADLTTRMNAKPQG
jgi:serine-type D-Ala-D-Ala carboxypeptidase/endopeptidase (penicillin-binding protein 4)